jgi:hypothetical protein
MQLVRVLPLPMKWKRASAAFAVRRLPPDKAKYVLGTPSTSWANKFGRGEIYFEFAFTLSYPHPRKPVMRLALSDAHREQMNE